MPFEKSPEQRHYSPQNTEKNVCSKATCRKALMKYENVKKIEYNWIFYNLTV